MPIKLSFRDNSSNESGFHVFRSSAPMSPDRLPQPFMTVGPNTDAIVDDQFGGIFERRWYYRVASFVDGETAACRMRFMRAMTVHRPHFSLIL